MRKMLTIILVLLMPALASAQENIIRKTGQTAGSLVQSTLKGTSCFAGVQEFNIGADTYIFYFQQHYTSKISCTGQYGPATTTFNILLSGHYSNYTRYTIDTIDRANACWLPVQPELLFMNADDDLETELCVVLRHIPRCDAFIPYTSVIFFDMYGSPGKKGRLAPLPGLAMEIRQPAILSNEQLRPLIREHIDRIHNRMGVKQDKPSLAGRYYGFMPVTKMPFERSVQSRHGTISLLPDSTCTIHELIYLFTRQVCDACNVVSRDQKGTWSVSGDTVFIHTEKDMLYTGGVQVQKKLLFDPAGGLTDVDNPFILFRRQPGRQQLSERTF